jgi:hypothetical protein
MSDLRRAVAAETEAFAPKRVPPFEAVLAGKRARDWRVRAGAGAVLAAVAVVGAVVVPSLLSASQERLVPPAAPPPAAPPPAAPPADAGTRTAYVMTYADGAAYRAQETAVEQCLLLPGASGRFQESLPPIVGVTVTGEQENRAFRDCIGAVDGVTIRSAVERRWADAPWAVQSVSEDRTSVTVRAYGLAAGCTGPGRGAAEETPDGIRLRVQVDIPADENRACAASVPMVPVTVELPRALRPGETVLGECIADDRTAEGRQCQDVRSFVSAPTPEAK